MIDSSFLLQNFIYQKIIRVINSFIVHLNAACASFIRRYHKADAFMIIAINTYYTERGRRRTGHAEKFKNQFSRYKFSTYFGKIYFTSVAPLYEVDDETSPKQLCCNDRRLIYNRYFQFTI